MAIERSALSWSVIAGADLSAKQFFACKLNSSKNAVVCGAGEAMTAGVNLGEPESGEAASFGLVGIFPVILGGSVTALDPITPDSAGEFVTAYGNDAVAGIVLEAGSDGEVVNALILPQLKVPMGSVIAIPVTLAKLANGDIVTTITPGYAGRISKMEFVVTDPATTGSKAATLNAEIGTTNLTGGALALTSANCTPLGNVVAAAAITAANKFSATDTISIEASSVTTFIEGAGVLLIYLN